ncbi:hypothetical protein OJAV_G00134230 [Oryzias javanicus]|uniref:Nuclear apoptosis-inducing factor 1 n=1 Tax=Oryzias javanicus TaxID=123683 RepID=A0A3S2PFA0_ORYJA|nr:hypothetical protein OJAV_G00134230 [Oryzias javanicus]
MATKWREEDEEFKIGGMTGGMKTKPRFSFHEIRMLLHAVRKNRFVLLSAADHEEWADLKCDGKRRITAMRGPTNGNNLRKKKMGPVERMVHKILMLTPETGPGRGRGPDEIHHPASATHLFSYLSMSDTSRSLPGEALDVSPTSTPDKDLGEPLQSSSDLDAPDEEGQKVKLLLLTLLNVPDHDPSAAVLYKPALIGAPRQEQVSALAAQSLRQQAAGRVLLSSVSQSLEALAQSVQLLVESQQELVQEALLLQRETVEVLRDFSNTALGMLRDKAGAGQPHAMQRF